MSTRIRMYTPYTYSSTCKHSSLTHAYPPSLSQQPSPPLRLFYSASPLSVVSLVDNSDTRFWLPSLLSHHQLGHHNIASFGLTTTKKPYIPRIRSTPLNIHAPTHLRTYAPNTHVSSLNLATVRQRERNRGRESCYTNRRYIRTP